MTGMAYAVKSVFCYYGTRKRMGANFFKVVALSCASENPVRLDGHSLFAGGDGGPVALAVFKTVVPPHSGGWVRLPFTSAILDEP